MATESTETASPVLMENGKTDFKIVIPQSAGISLKRTADRIAERFAENGVDIEIIRDGGNMNKNVPTDTYEILLGNTNRAESKAQKSLPELGYVCFATDRRVGIKAVDDEQLEVAIHTVFAKLEDSMVDGKMQFSPSLAEAVNWDEGRREGWLMYGIPSYEGGRLSTALYDCGSGLRDYSNKPEDNSRLQFVRNTNASELEAYIDSLEASGYIKEFENKIGGNSYFGYRLGGMRLYVYYTASIGECRIIQDRNSTQSISDFGYTYKPSATDETVFYAYALVQSDTGLQTNNCGQLEVIKLSDNSLFIIDGGMNAQFDKAAEEGFVSFARQITGTPEGEKVRVSCWFLTHDHGDHREGLEKVIASRSYSNNFTVERLAYNYLQSAGNANTPRFLENMNALYPECEMLKLHTGMRFEIADMQIEVLATHEDLSISTGKTSIRDFNDSSTVIKLTAGGVDIMILGDTSTKSEEAIMERIPEAALKADIVQVAHHTWNDLPKLYEAVGAEYAVFTQTEGASNRTLGIYAKKVLMDVQQYADPENCYFSGKTTTGLLLKDRTVSVKDTYPLYWNSPDHVWGNVYEGVDMDTVIDHEPKQ